MISRCKSSKRSILLLSACAASMIPCLARADKTWDPAISDGSWNTPSNWLGGVLPGTSDGATIKFNDAVDHTITYDGSYSNPIGAVTITNQGGGNTNLALSNSYTMETGGFSLGGGGRAGIVQSDGTIKAIAVKMAPDSASDVATYTLSGGTLSLTGRLSLGKLGNATFNQSGGTLLLTSSDGYDGFYVGGSGGVDSGIGHYEMSGGTIITGTSERIGWYDSTSQFVQSGGTHINTSVQSYSGLWVGPFWSSPAGPVPPAYVLTGGTLNTGYEYVLDRALSQSGGYHSAVYLQGGSRLSGGELNVSTWQQDGANDQSGGTYNLGSAATPGFLAGDYYTLSGGVFNAIGSESFGGGGLFVARSGTFNQSGGTHNLGTEAVPSGLYLGFSAGRIGTYSLSGTGALNVVGREFVGYSGSGSFVQSGGTHALGTSSVPGQLYIGYNANPSRVSWYRQTGGVFNLIGTEYVGYNASGWRTLSIGALHSVSGSVYVGGNETAESSTGRGSISTGGTFIVTGTMKVWNESTVTYTNGSMSLGGLDVTGGLVQMVANTTHVMRAGSISTSSGGKIDLNDNAIIVDYPAAGPSSESSIFAQIQSGYNNGAWNGPGINSTVAAGNPSKRIGYADNAVLLKDSFNGEPVDPSSILIELTYGGDANLDGAVNIADLYNLAQHWNSSGDWLGGDFDYNGTVNISDLQILAGNWGSGTSLVALEASFGLPMVDVPEPSLGAFAIFAFCAGLKLQRARRQ